MLPDLKHDFYGAFITEAKTGPRRELHLSVELWPRGVSGQRLAWRRGEGRIVHIRFGGIANFDTVDAFFTEFANSANSGEGLHHLRYDAGVPSKPGRLFLEIEFDRTGDGIQIRCQSVNIWECPEQRDPIIPAGREGREVD